MATIGTVSFYTLGCKLNYSETSAIGRQFTDAGYQEVDFGQGADVVVINTCSVTDFADRKCRNIVRRALGANAGAKIVVVGCYAQLKPAEIADIEGVDLVLGAAEKFRILEYIDGIGTGAGKGMVRAGEVKEADTFISSFSFGDRTRSFLKVQDGCDYKCTFCTIPLARGKSRSSTVEQIVADAEAIAARGVKEIVLTGVNIGDFGNGTSVIEGQRPRKEALFVDLARALDEVEGITRFRISSIEPNLCTDEIIDFVAQSKRFAPHFHMPLQSGNNKQLAQMRRRYKRELYAERVAHIKQVMPHACIGVDLIVGFPGETEEDFLETYRFVQELDVSYFHVFTYSERANTPAAEMDGAVPMAERKRRNKMLNILSEKKRRAHYEAYAGDVRPVLLEKSKEEGILQGFTDNYVRVSFPAEDSWINHLVDMKLGEIGEDGLVNAEVAEAAV
ncbi:tRNA (N(6)-L-threonylcarbamoyladenosine(37)-C(2))-methylthiotransferase MtaB [Lewinella sp. W8]|uniref:tRNA (N(6)-L-threonylcarbamoyladenosine(37)-C(2))- methylthiotransferase MtaB n=1 Tax=Lewinella sp. W8 TaxID=2528208 RepID=UPI001068A136|nr:tRNA (N(6)-L-threonylcarbamoyladenosine(37)-C(2))-methylthiotransferase MtaB [Lewinella sp. W8]MTB52761.1 tRNA (N(6)-L-threonylcarbamoyladenosine(37)-C(2))-methylthiotransferase MtaB [Lewinella sp. W8]